MVISGLYTIHNLKIGELLKIKEITVSIIPEINHSPTYNKPSGKIQFTLTFPNTCQN